MSAWCRYCNAPVPTEGPRVGTRVCDACWPRLLAGEELEPRELSLLELIAERKGVLVIRATPELCGFRWRQGPWVDGHEPWVTCVRPKGHDVPHACEDDLADEVNDRLDAVAEAIKGMKR